VSIAMVVGVWTGTYPFLVATAIITAAPTSKLRTSVGNVTLIFVFR
jgi:hypothetical protein